MLRTLKEILAMKLTLGNRLPGIRIEVGISFLENLTRLDGHLKV
jgi:hypothetical protein